MADSNVHTVITPGSGAWLPSVGLLGCMWLPAVTPLGPLPTLLLGLAVLLVMAEQQEAAPRWSHHAAVTTLHALSGQAKGVDSALPGAPPGHRAEGGTENEMKGPSHTHRPRPRCLGLSHTLSSSSPSAP